MLFQLLTLAVCVTSNLASSCSRICESSDLILTNNRYDGVVIAINPNITENPEIIDNLKVSLLNFCSGEFL